MAHPLSARVEQLFDEAERDRSLATYSDNAQMQCMRRRVRAKSAVAPIPRLFARTAYWETLDPRERMEHMMRGLATVRPDTVFAGPSAALAHGLPISFGRLSKPCVATDRRSHTESSPSIQRICVQGDDSATANGFCVTSLLRTVSDCLRTFDFRDGLAIADAALRKEGMSSNQLVERLSEFGPRKGIRRVIETACHADARSESGGESIARAVMIENGFQVPELQVEFAHPLDPGKVFRADYCWRLDDGTVVVGELDGREKYRNPEMTGGRDVVDVLADERLRETFINATGAKVMRFSYKNVLDEAYFASLLDLFGVPRVA